MSVEQRPYTDIEVHSYVDASDGLRTAAMDYVYIQRALAAHPLSEPDSEDPVKMTQQAKVEAWEAQINKEFMHTARSISRVNRYAGSRADAPIPHGGGRILVARFVARSPLSRRNMEEQSAGIVVARAELEGTSLQRRFKQLNRSQAHVNIESLDILPEFEGQGVDAILLGFVARECGPSQKLRAESRVILGAIESSGLEPQFPVHYVHHHGSGK